MNVIVASAAWMKLKFWGDIIGSIACLFVVPGMIVTTVFWAIGGGGSITTFVGKSSAVHAVRGEVSQIKTDLSVATDSKKIMYRLRLVDLKGNTVYTYPDSDVTDVSPEMGNVLVQVPNTITRGQYDLYADIRYAKNPIRSEIVKIKVARIFVEED